MPVRTVVQQHVAAVPLCVHTAPLDISNGAVYVYTVVIHCTYCWLRVYTAVPTVHTVVQWVVNADSLDMAILRDLTRIAHFPSLTISDMLDEWSDMANGGIHMVHYCSCKDPRRI